MALNGIVKGDNVVIICGKDKGVTGEVVKFLPKKNAVLVKNIATSNQINSIRAVE